MNNNINLKNINDIIKIITKCSLFFKNEWREFVSTMTIKSFTYKFDEHSYEIINYQFTDLASFISNLTELEIIDLVDYFRQHRGGDFHLLEQTFYLLSWLHNKVGMHKFLIMLKDDYSLIDCNNFSFDTILTTLTDSDKINIYDNYINYKKNINDIVLDKIPHYDKGEWFDSVINKTRKQKGFPDNVKSLYSHKLKKSVMVDSDKYNKLITEINC